MLVAVYKGNKYKFVSNKRRKGIITRCVQKTDGSFLKENDIYYKPVDEKDLSDIYTIEFYLTLTQKTPSDEVTIFLVT